MESFYLNVLTTRYKTLLAKAVIYPVLLCVITFATGGKASAQPCVGGTPSFTINLSGNPDSVWTSPGVFRNGLCCGATSPDQCIEFIITLDSNTEGIKLDLCSGAVPSGAMFFQINCGGAYPVGQPVCVSGVGPHRITFCKPGNNRNQYCITAIPKPLVSPDVVVAQACTQELYVTGLVKDSIKWKSHPQVARYDSFLSCRVGCDTVTVTPYGTFPTYVDYAVSGLIDGGCANSYFFDTIRVYLVTTLGVQIYPPNPTICYGDTSLYISARPIGGLAPYSFKWSTLETDSVINVGPGTYTVELKDSLGCYIARDTVVVTAFTMPIKALPGGPANVCMNSGYLQLNGAVQAAGGGKWYGPGTFVPSDTVLNARYYFTAAEKLAGSATLKLVTTGNGTCPPDSDLLSVSINPNPVPLINGPGSVCAYTSYTYSLGSTTPDSLFWSVSGGTILGSANQSTVTVQWGAAGAASISLTRKTAFGCDSSITRPVVIRPTPVPVISGPDSTCQNHTYTYSVTAVAGDTYSWSVSGGTIQGSSTSNMVNILWAAPGAGTVTLTQTNSFGCDSIASKTVTVVRTPIPVIAGPDTTCQNKLYTYTVNGMAGDTYAWSVTGGVIQGPSTSNTVSIRWAGPGTGTITLVQRSFFGCDSSTSSSVTIRPTPAPVISGPATACQNHTYTYSVTPVAGHTYTWSVSGGTIQGSSTGSTVVILWGAAGTGISTLTQTNAFGCDSNVRDTVTINPTPVPVISGPTSVCQNKLYNYSVTAVAGHTYSWSVSGAVIQGPNNTSSVQVRWLAPGTGTVTLTQTSAAGCDSTVSETTTVNPTPAPVITGPAVACQNKTTTHSVTAVAGNTYAWSVTGGTIQGSGTGSSVTIRWGTAGPGIITMTQTLGTCDSVVYDTVTINPTPAPVITGPAAACQNKTTTHSVTAVAGHSYAWSVTGGTIQGSGTGNSVIIRWAAPGTGLITMTQTSAAGCDSTVRDTVTINPTPAPVISGPATTCQNKLYTYSVTAVAGHTYAWSVSGGVIQGPNNTNSVQIRWGAAGNGFIAMTQTSGAGCDSLVRDTVTINPTPAPVINGQDSTCQNKRYTYSTPALAGHTYSWSVSGGSIEGSATSNTVNIRWGAAGAGTVTVTQTSAFGCDSTVSLNGIVIMPTPAPVISGTDSACQNKRYTYSTPAVAGHTYSWSVSGGSIEGSNTSNAVNIRWAASGTGTITLTQTSGFGCDSTVSLNGIVIMPTPAPVISGTDSVCQNKRYTYSTPAVAGHTYSWSVNGGSIEGSSTTNTVNIRWAASGTGTITLTQTSGFGCDSTVSLNGIVIMPTPAPVISGTDSVCQNKRYTYSTPAVAGHTYSWSVNGGSIEGSSTTNTVNIRWAASGTGTITLTQTSGFGCDSTVSLNGIVIMPTPAPVVSGTDSVCQNKRYTYSTPAVTGHTYSWSVSGGTIEGSATSNTVNIRWAVPGTGSLTVTQTSAFGCDSTVSLNGIVIMPIPAPVIVGPDSGCQNKIYTYNVTAVSGNTYSWSVNGGVIHGSTTSSTAYVSWPAPGVGSVTVTQTSTFGCDSTVSFNGIDILPTPIPVIIGPDSTCQNKRYTYSTPAVAGHAYSWSVSGGSIEGSATSSTVNIRWAAPGTGVITLTQTSAFGCDSTIKDSVTILPTPAPIIIGPDSTCQNKVYAYSVTAVSGHAYNWSVSGGTIQGSATSSMVSIRWATPGTGSVTVTQTSAFGCDSTVSLNGINILPTPAPVISGTDSACQNKRYTYSTPAVASHTYSWSVSGGSIEGSATSNTVNIRWAAPGTGSVTVTQTSAFGCDSTVSMNGINILPAPAPVISGPDSTCQNKVYAYSVTAVSGHTYSWSVSGGAIQGSATSATVNIRWAAPGTGLVTVTQTSAFGCDSIVMDTVTILPAPAPVISGADSACQNKIYSYSVTAISGHTYNWSVNSAGVIQGSSTSNTVDIIWLTPGAGTVTVTATQASPFGCDSTVSKSGITILPTPAPVINGPDSTCQNKLYTYSVTAIAGHTYSWSVSGGSIQGSATSSSANIRWGTTGTGVITLTQTSAFGCDSTVKDSVVIMPTPAPVIFGPDSVCQNKLYSYTAASVSGHTYSWSVSGGTIQGSATSNIVNIRWATPGTGTVTLTQTSAFGCDSTVSYNNINILPTPAPVIAGPDSTCQNKLYAYSVTAVSGHTYSWSVNGGSIEGPATSNTVNIRWAAPGTGSVTVTQTSAFGCDSTVSMNNIDILPTLAPVISGPDSTCQNKIYNYSTPAIAGYTYSWSVNGGAIAGSATSNTMSVRWAAPGTGTVTVTQTSALGCDSILTDTVTILPTPAPVISGADSACQNKIYSYSVTAISGHTYNWSVNGAGVIQGSTTSNTVDVIWLTPGAGTVTVTVTQTSPFGCDSTVSKSGITVLPTPVPVISGPDSTCQNKLYTYSVTAIAGHTYSWSVSGGSIQGSATSSSANIRWGTTGTGVITLTQTSAFGCDSTVKDSVVIMPTPAPVISGPDSVCQNKLYSYSVTSVAGHTYSWSVNGGTIEGSTTSAAVNVRWAMPGAGTVTVTQTSAFGCDSTVSYNNINILPTPAPVISGPANTCQNKLYTYRINPVSGHTYSWSVSGGLIQGSATSDAVDIRWGAPGIGIVRMTQVSSFGCDSTVMDTVVILPTPAPVISGPDSTCQNQMYTYTVTAMAGHTYSWSATGGVIQGPSSSNTVSIRWAAPGTGSVTVTQTSPAGCDSTVSRGGISILPTPAPVISGPGSVCQNKLYTYSVTSVSGHTYSWSVNGGTIQGSSASNTVDIRWAAPGTGIVTVTQTSAFGCDSTVSLDNIDIRPTPAPVISGPDSTCQNKMYTYTVTAMAGHTYSWSVTGGVIQGPANASTVSIRWAAPGKGRITMTQTSDFGCDSIVKDSVVILPTPAPVIFGPDSACQNKRYMYSVVAVPGNTYSWSVNGGTIEGSATSAAVNVRWAMPGTGSVTVTQTNAFGCDSTVSYNNIDILPTPAPVISGPGSGCQNKLYTYSTPAVTGHTYSWSVSGGTIEGPATSNTVNIRWALPGTGSMTVTQTSAFGCDSTVSINNINILPTPAPVVSGPDSACQNKRYTYSTPAVAGHTYSWSVSGGTIEGPATSNAVNVRWAAPGTGMITLVQTSAAGCDSMVKDTVTILPTPAPVLFGPDTVCQYTTATYTYTGQNIKQVTWSVLGGKILTGQFSDTLSVLWDTAGAGIIFLHTVSPYGCDSMVMSSTKVLTHPSLGISGPDTVCQRASTLYSTGQVAGLKYFWTVEKGFLMSDPTGTTINVVWNLPGPAHMSVVYTSPNGCKGKTDMPVFVHELPDPLIEGNLKGCANSQGNPYNLNIYKSAGKNLPPLEYSWSVSNGATLSGNGNDSVFIDWGGPGLYRISLSITNTETGCSDTASLPVEVGEIIKPEIETDQEEGCVPLEVTMKEKSGAPGLDYQWSLGNNGTSEDSVVTLLYNKPGTYQLRLIVSNEYECKDTAVFTITAHPKPYADFSVTNKLPLYLGDTARFVNKSQAASAYEWQFHDGTTDVNKDSRKHYPEPGVFPVTLFASNAYGCMDSVTKQVPVTVNPRIYVPNAFTPNGDNKNQHFTVTTYYIVELEVIILNRWGEIIYRSDQLDFKWDGTYMGVDCQQDVYVYVIHAKGWNNEPIFLSGDVTLIR